MHMKKETKIYRNLKIDKTTKVCTCKEKDT